MQTGKLLSTIFLLTTSHALASITTYTSSAAFDAALAGSPTAVEDYATFSLSQVIAPGSTFNGITYTSFNLSAGATEGLITNQFNSFTGVSLGANQSIGAQYFFDSDSFDIDFAPTYAIGVFYNVNANSGTYGFSTPVGTANTGSAAYDISSFVFAGLISTTPFTTATIFSDSGGNGTASFNITKIILDQTAAAPEPASITVTALGAGLLAAFLRRRKAV